MMLIYDKQKSLFIDNSFLIKSHTLVTIKIKFIFEKKIKMKKDLHD